MRINQLFGFFLLFLSCTHSPEGESGRIPVIYLNPDHAETLKFSDYFDGISVVLLQGEIVSSFSDFTELDHGYVACVQPEKGEARNLYVYDKEGHFRNRVGSIGRGPGERLEILNSLQVDPEGTIRVLDWMKYLKYNLSGEVLHEEALYPSGEKIPHVDGFSYVCNDTLLMSYREEVRGGTIKILNQMRKSQENKYMCTFYSLNTHRITNTFFPLTGLCDYVYNHHLYKYRDTLRLHHDRDGIIYDLFPDKVIPHYRIDRGKYDRRMTVREEIESYGNDTDFTILFITGCNETDQYVWGGYFFNGRHYTYVYDKKTGVTKNYRDKLDDVGRLVDLKAANDASWETGMRFKEDYLWRKYTYNFVDIMEELKSSLSTGEWELYGREHPDVLRTYELLNDELNGKSADEILGDKVVLVRYHFK